MKLNINVVYITCIIINIFYASVVWLQAGTKLTYRANSQATTVG